MGEPHLLALSSHTQLGPFGWVLAENLSRKLIQFILLVVVEECKGKLASPSTCTSIARHGWSTFLYQKKALQRQFFEQILLHWMVTKGWYLHHTPQLITHVHILGAGKNRFINLSKSIYYSQLVQYFCLPWSRDANGLSSMYKHT